MGQPVMFFEVLGADGNALRSFYGELFGWEYDQAPGPMDYGMVSAGDKGIDGGVGTAPNGGTGHVTFYVHTADLEASLTRAGELGGTTMMPATELPGGGGVIALFADPEGHTVGLYEPPGS